MRISVFLFLFFISCNKNHFTKEPTTINKKPILQSGTNIHNTNIIDFIHELNLFCKLPKIIPNYTNCTLKKYHTKRLEDLYCSKLISPQVCSILKKESQNGCLKEYVYKVCFLRTENSFLPKFRVIVNDMNKKNIDKIISYYMFLIYLRNKYNPKSIPFSKDVYIYIIPQDIHKKICNPITAYNVNSGCTFVYDNILGNVMYLWRQDEFFKVLIHETLHSIHFDKLLHEEAINTPSVNEIDTKNVDYDTLSLNSKNNFKDDNYSDHIKKFKNINCLKIHEAYNELGATYFSALLEAASPFVVKKADTAGEKLLCAKIPDKTFLEDKLNKILKRELQHSIDNVCKLMKIFDIKDFRNILKTKKIKQYAPIFSYIVLKTGLLWLFLNNETPISLQQFISLGFTGDPKKAFFQIIDKIFCNNRFANRINERYQKLKDYRSEIEKIENFEFTTFE